jgi:hypothetical protein
MRLSGALRIGSMNTKLAILMIATLLAVPAAKAEDASGGEPYEPSIGDIMTLQQARHIKLWFAGRAGNWPLADYEIGKLKDGFDDVNKLIGGETVENAVGGPIGTLEKAIAGRDRDSFTRAFDQLTDGCNSCHHTLDHAFVVIQRPSLQPYSNQSFAPRK